MKCGNCGKGRMAIGRATVESSVRGETHAVTVEGEVCNRCGFVVFTEEQAGLYTIASADAYRKAHGLLTNAELKAARRRLGMTQQQFADRLRVGVASVKRWELGAIQDESSDRLIRLSTDLQAAQDNLRQIKQFTARATAQISAARALRTR